MKDRKCVDYCPVPTEATGVKTEITIVNPLKPIEVAMRTRQVGTKTISARVEEGIKDGVAIPTDSIICDSMEGVLRSTSTISSGVRCPHTKAIEGLSGFNNRL